MPLQRPTPGHRIPRLAPGQVPGTHRPFHERVKGTKRPPRSPRHTAVPRPDGHLWAHKPIPQGHARLPPAPRPTPPRYLSQMESSSQAPWSSVSGEQEERELKDGLLRLAAGRGCGRPGLLCPAGTRSGVHGRARPGREPQSAAGLRGARLWPGRRGSPTPPTPPATVARQPRALLSSRARAAAQTLPGRCPAPSGGGLRTGTGTPSWENSWGPAHTLRTFAEREGALTGTQGPRQARSRGTAASSLGFYSNVRPQTTQRLQANLGSQPFDTSLSSLCSSTTSDWAMETKYKMNKRDYIKVKKSSARQRKPSTKPKRNLTPGRRYLQTVYRIRG